MAYHLPELDRISKALSRLETALLTNRRSYKNEDSGIDDTVLQEENQKLQLQCELLEKQLYEVQLVLVDLLRLKE